MSTAATGTPRLRCALPEPDERPVSLRSSCPSLVHPSSAPSRSSKSDQDNDGDTADGNPRFADDTSTNDTACGLPVIIDMRAYEFPGDAAHPLRIGHINDDGVVNGADLPALLFAPKLAAWARLIIAHCEVVKEGVPRVTGSNGEG